MKTFGIIALVIGGIIAISIIGMIAKVVLFPLSTTGTLIDTAYEIKDKTLDADNVIYNYEWFKQRYEDIKATEKKIIIAQNTVEDFKKEAGDREKWTFEDKTEFARLGAVNQGLMNILEDQIATYNARSKMANRTIFKDGLIPDVLEIGKNILSINILK